MSRTHYNYQCTIYWYPGHMVRAQRQLEVNFLQMALCGCRDTVGIQGLFAKTQRNENVKTLMLKLGRKWGCFPKGTAPKRAFPLREKRRTFTMIRI